MKNKAAILCAVATLFSRSDEWTELKIQQCWIFAVAHVFAARNLSSGTRLSDTSNGGRNPLTAGVAYIGVFIFY